MGVQTSGITISQRGERPQAGPGEVGGRERFSRSSEDVLKPVFSSGIAATHSDDDMKCLCKCCGLNNVGIRFEEG